MQLRPPQTHPGRSHDSSSSASTGSSQSRRFSLARFLSPRLAVLLVLCAVAQMLRLYISLSDLHEKPSPWESRLPADEYFSSFDSPESIYYSTSAKGRRRCRTPRVSDEEMLRDHSDVTVVTLVGRSGRADHPGYLNFIRSLDTQGYNRLLVLEPAAGLQEIRTLKRTNYTVEADFWYNRLRRFLEVVDGAPQTSILLFCDALDVYFTQSSSTLIQRFRSFNKSVVFAAEVLCDTVSCRTDVELKDYLTLSGPQGNPYKYLNAGMFMGYASALQSTINCALAFSKGGRDDQNAFTMCYRLNRAWIGLDHDSILFGNIPPVAALFDASWSTYDSKDQGEPGAVPSLKIHRNHMPRGIYPVAFHFLGMSFRRDLPFVPCQQFLREKYNLLRHLAVVKDTQASSFVSLDRAATLANNPYNVIVLSQIFVTAMIDEEEFLNVHSTNRPDSLGACVQYLEGMGVFQSLKGLRVSLRSVLASGRKISSKEYSAVINRVYLVVRIQFEASSEHQSTVATVILEDILKCIDIVADSWMLERFKKRDSEFIFKRIVHSFISPDGSSQRSDERDGADIIDRYPHELINWLYENEFKLSRDLDTPLDSLLLLTVSGQHAYGSGVIASLIDAYRFGLSNAAYGHTGILVDAATRRRSQQPSTIEKFNSAYMRAAGHWVEGKHVVDILSIEGGALYNLSSLYNTNSQIIVNHGSYCVYPYELETFLGSLLTLKGLPLIQIPVEPRKENHAVEIPIVTGEVAASDLYRKSCTSDLSGLKCAGKIATNALYNMSYTFDINAAKMTLSNAELKSVYFQASRKRANIISCPAGKSLVANLMKNYWKGPGDFEENFGPFRGKAFGQTSTKTDVFSLVTKPSDVEESVYCKVWLDGLDAISPIPVVPDLGGFSWKQNWNLASATSPCTCHLFTRIVDGQSYLGKGQYMGQNQYIASKSGAYILRLDLGAKLCLYSAVDSAVGRHIKCLSPPIVDAQNDRDCYVSLINGSVCFFVGRSPYFGGSASDSGHRELIWC